uniref:Glycosyltransferase 2-like domain-containing protein n=1 Tax=Arcella intermedia TaxID=1963864 RepID=A0A6B2LAJ1_9EUKA
MYGQRTLKRGITLVLHCDVSKMVLLNKTLELWEGPVSICVFIPTKNLTVSTIKTIDQYRAWFPRMIVTIYSSDDTYPINILRNRAAQKTETELAFPIDLDFLPNPDLYSNLMNMYDEMVRNSERSLYVVPAFNYNFNFENHSSFSFVENPFPTTKEDLMMAVEVGNVSYSHWGNAHLPTNYPKWMNSTEMYRIKPGWNYEPYIVASFKYVPFFDERFIVYGDDKTQWHRHMAFLDYEYWVVPDCFIIHVPHKLHNWAGKERKEVLPRVITWIKEFSEDLMGKNSATKVNILSIPPFILYISILWLFGLLQ